MKGLKRGWIIVLGVVLMASLAWAAGHGGEEAAWNARAWKDFFWRCLNFALFLAIIYKLAGGKIKEFFGGRTQQIEEEFKNLETRKQEAETKLKEVEKRIANLEQEREAILEEARRQGEAIKNAIIEKARRDAEEIKKQAEVKARQEFEQEVEKIRAEMADKIIESAEKIILSRLGVKEQEKLIDKYLTRVVLN